jgi:hypothetical protein
MVFASLFNIILIHSYSPPDVEKNVDKMGSNQSLYKVNQIPLHAKKHD